MQNYNLKVKFLFTFNFLFVFFIFAFLLLPSSAYAIVNPLNFPNNKVGIHIISPTDQEASEAAQLVNSSGGDWGYVTVLIGSKDRDHDKWQTFFDNLRQRHLIPLVRLATQTEDNSWKVPSNSDANDWANFLDSLNWPTKNRYVIIYNEPNQGKEWGGTVDAASYAKILDQTITALKSKNPDFFVLNAGFDASAPNKLPSYEDEYNFLKTMNDTVPGIFNKLDGWASHSYPNPGYTGSPDDSGRGTVRTWDWELSTLKELGLKKDLPVFITETGWKHAEGLNYDRSLPTSDMVGQYLKEAFNGAWNDPRIVAVTPFLLDYQAEPFDHFSFKKITLEGQNTQILGASYPDYYPQYEDLMQMPKTAGHPFQENKAQLIHGEIYSSLAMGEQYFIPLTFKNTGQSIWNEYGHVELRMIQGQDNLGSMPVLLPENEKIKPGDSYTFYVSMKAPLAGSYKISLQLYQDNQPFDQSPLEFNTTVKSPVVLNINASLAWKKNFSGNYFLSAVSYIIDDSTKVTLNSQGQAQNIEMKYLLPDYTFNFTLQKPFYQPKTIQVKVHSGINNLNFGTLNPDFWSVIGNPQALWKLFF